MKRIFPLLCAALLLTACAAGKTEEPAPTADLPADEEILLVINGREVPAWRYLCWLERSCTAAAQEQGLSSLSGQAGEALKARALFDTALYAAVEDMADRYGVTLTAEEAAAADASAWSSLPAEHGAELAAVAALYAKLCTLATAPDSALSPDTDTLTAFAQESNCITLDRILIPAGEGAADAVAALYARLNGGGQAAFDAAKAESADAAGARTFRMGDGTMSLALESAAAVLEPGQLSGILETGEGYSILLRLPTDLTDVVIPWLDHQLQTAAETADVQTTAGYDTLDVSAFAASFLREANQKSPALSST